MVSYFLVWCIYDNYLPRTASTSELMLVFWGFVMHIMMVVGYFQLTKRDLKVFEREKENVAPIEWKEELLDA